jgi:glucose/arabinose dehydrogenase
VKLTPLVQLDEPVAFAVRADDPTLFIAERAGRVRAVRNDRLDPEPVLDISDRTRAGGERGLLGITFSTDGALLYVNYTDVDGHTRVVEFAMDNEGRAYVDTARELLRQDQPYSNHNGGHILRGPDGMLYIGLGDGGAQGDPERLSTDPGSLLGKMLRIDPRPDGDRPYTVPADNPWADGSGGYEPEIWSTGLRNPWRYSFDRATGDLWVADVGQNWVEEITMSPAGTIGRGAFYGWSALEGNDRFNADVSADGALAPTFTYNRNASPGGCSVTGGFVYRGARIPGLQGTYLFADYCTSVVRALKPAASGGYEEVSVADGAPNVVSFGEDQDGELYVLSLGTGTVWRLDPA